MRSLSLQRLPFLEIGYALVLLSFLQVSLMALLLIIAPLIIRQGGWSHRLWTLVYFAGIGIGFMVIEMVLIHKISFYLGNPVLASGLTIGILLVWSGVGSYWSER